MDPKLQIVLEQIRSMEEVRTWFNSTWSPDLDPDVIALREEARQLEAADEALRTRLSADEWLDFITLRYAEDRPNYLCVTDKDRTKHLVEAGMLLATQQYMIQVASVTEAGSAYLARLKVR